MVSDDGCQARVHGLYTNVFLVDLHQGSCLQLGVYISHDRLPVRFDLRRGVYISRHLKRFCRNATDFCLGTDKSTAEPMGARPKRPCRRNVTGAVPSFSGLALFLTSNSRRALDYMVRFHGACLRLGQHCRGHHLDPRPCSQRHVLCFVYCKKTYGIARSVSETLKCCFIQSTL